MKLVRPPAAAFPVAWLPPMALPAEDVTLIEAVLAVRLPAESSISTTGWVTSTEPLAPPTGCVMIASLPAAPTVTWTLVEVTEVRPLEAKVSV